MVGKQEVIQFLSEMGVNLNRVFTCQLTLSDTQPQQSYSYRKATIGSTRMARRAGM